MPMYHLQLVDIITWFLNITSNSTVKDIICALEIAIIPNFQIASMASFIPSSLSFNIWRQRMLKFKAHSSLFPLSINTYSHSSHHVPIILKAKFISSKWELETFFLKNIVNSSDSKWKVSDRISYDKKNFHSQALLYTLKNGRQH